MSGPCYSIVIPIHNEAETLAELARQLSDLMSRLDDDAEVILVDDGSTDDSPAIIQKICDEDSRVRSVWLSRNFGHQIAITAGLDQARGQAVVIMDADLQDPPEVVLEMARQWRAGHQIIYGVREERVGDSPLKRVTARWFYRVLNRLTDIEIPRDVGEFRLVDRAALDVVLNMREHHRFLRGMFAWVGFDQSGVKFVRAPRYAGSTKYSIRRMVRFAADGLLSFSAVPLRAVLALGLTVTMASFMLGVIALVLELTDAYSASTWVAATLGVAFVTGFQLTVLGVIGAYVARIHDEVRQRPLYVLREGPVVPRGGSDSQ